MQGACKWRKTRPWDCEKFMSEKEGRNGHIRGELTLGTGKIRGSGRENGRATGSGAP